MQDKLYIVIPAYNEEANIRKVVDEWYPIAVMAGEDSRLVIVDDGSRDNTLAVLKEEQKNRPKLIVTEGPSFTVINSHCPKGRIMFSRPIRTDRQIPRNSRNSTGAGATTTW